MIQRHTGPKSGTVLIIMMITSVLEIVITSVPQEKLHA